MSDRTFIYVPSMHVTVHGESRMSLLKKVSVLALLIVALIVPAVAISENTAGEAELRDGSIWVSRGFDDRTSGTITVRVFNDVSVPLDNVRVSVTDSISYVEYASGYISMSPESEYADISLSFRIGSPGKYWVDVEISGSSVNSKQSTMHYFEFEVNRSIWSNTWTYVAIILVIVIAGIGVFIKIRSTPKVEKTDTFTAMEEEKKAGKKKSVANKEEYKGRSPKK